MQVSSAQPKCGLCSWYPPEGRSSGTACLPPSQATPGRPRCLPLRSEIEGPCRGPYLRLASCPAESARSLSVQRLGVVVRLIVIASIPVLLAAPLTGQECSPVAVLGDELRVKMAAQWFLFGDNDEEQEVYIGELARVTLDSLTLEWTSWKWSGGVTVAVADVDHTEKRCPTNRNRLGTALKAGLYAGGACAALWLILGNESGAGDAVGGVLLFYATAFFVSCAAPAALMGALLAPSSVWVTATVQPANVGSASRRLHFGLRLPIH